MGAGNITDMCVAYLFRSAYPQPEKTAKKHALLTAQMHSLTESETKLQTILDNVDAYIFLKDLAGKYLFVNKPVCDLLQRDHSEIVGFYDRDLFDDETTAQIRANDQHVIAKKEVLRDEEYIQIPGTGESGTYKVTKLPFIRNGDKTYALCGISVDITAHKETEKALRESEKRFKLAGEIAYDLVYEWDARSGEVTWFGDIDGMLGYEPGIISQSLDAWLARVHPDNVEQIRRGLEVHKNSTEPYCYHYRIRHRDGHYRCWSNQGVALLDDDKTPGRWIGVCADITQMKQQQEKLEYLAYHDVLTGLPNRSLLADRLEQAIVQQQRRGKQLAIVYIDLDEFKEVNDRYGHDVGDQLLVAISQRFQSALRKVDTVARLGGDEFIAVLSDLEHKEALLPLLERLQQAVIEPVSLAGETLQISASMGVAFYPQSEDLEASQLIRQADKAMYHAKAMGKNRYHFFDNGH